MVLNRGRARSVKAETSTPWIAQFGIALCCVFVTAASQAAVFCATNSAELQAHLDTAEVNGEADVIRLARGSYNAPAGNGNGFHFNPSAPTDGDDQDLTLIGGWFSFGNSPCGGSRTTRHPSIRFWMAAMRRGS